jgi:glycerophosphoryl diester phosphodiesterase
MKNIIALFVLICIAPSCQKEEFDIVNLNNNRVLALGHGGMGIGHTYPMNSFESILNCLNLGADGTEIDIQMTKDSVLVAFHDESLEHSTNMSGQIFNKKWSEICNAVYTDLPYTNYRLITLDELFSTVANQTEYTFFLDCKNFNPDTSSAYLNTFNNALVKIIDDHHLENNVYIELKRKDFIKSLKTIRPALKIFVYNDFDVALEFVNEFQLEGITISIDNISKDEVKKAHNNGTMIAVFNAHSKNRNMDAIKKNVDFIQSDKVKHLIKTLK